MLRFPRFRLRIEKYDLVRAIVLGAGLYGLFLCAPGFRPKELRDFALAFAGPRGIGIAAACVAFALLLPAAERLRALGFVRTRVAGIFACLSALLAADFVFDSGWAVRFGYLGIAVFGFLDRAAARRAVSSVVESPRWVWRGLSRFWPRLFFILVAFFFARQELHLLFTRGAPGGDEVYFWYTASKDLMEHGLHFVLTKHSYMPGLPWLASLPSRLAGSVNPELLFAYPLLVMCFFAALMLELSSTAWAFVSGSALLFFVFLSSRDLHSQFGASFCGEALAALLTAGLLAEIHLLTSADLRKAGRLAGLGLFIGFCALARPGIAELSRAVAVAVAFTALVASRRALAKAWAIAPLLALSFLPFALWRVGLVGMNRPPEYRDLTLLGFIRAGADWSIPWSMIKGLLIPGSPQAAYVHGLIGALLIGLCLGARRFLGFVSATVALYWGFTFVLYATLWRHMERGSAGRYLSHAAVAAVLALPLAFQALTPTPSGQAAREGS